MPNTADKCDTRELSLKKSSAPVPISPPTDPAPFQSKKSEYQINANNWSRWIDDQRYVGGLSQMAIAAQDLRKTDETTDSDRVSAEIQIEALVGSGTGLVIGTIIHYMIRKKYSKKRSLNPLYRTFKTLASVGAALGSTIGYALPLNKNAQKIASIILADVVSFTFGLIAFPYWLIREYVLTTPEKDRNKYSRTGSEGWSKYGKTLLVFGTALGQALGALHSLLAGSNVLFDIAVGGGICGVSAFFVGLVLIPLINKYCNNALITDQNTFRNNYVRTGIVAGTSAGSVVGFFLGSIVFPGLGSVVGMAIGGAIGGIIGGVIGGFAGKKITLSMHPGAAGPKPIDIENSWDYVTRGTAYMGASLGAVIGFFAPIPGGALVGAALGAAIGSTIGWVCGFGVIKVARAISPIEKPANSLPWTQRVATGSNIFSLVCGMSACIAGFIVFGPLGALAGAAIGYAIGGVVGSIVGIFYDPKEKNKVVDKPVQSKPENKELTDKSKQLQLLNPSEKNFDIDDKHFPKHTLYSKNYEMHGLWKKSSNNSQAQQNLVRHGLLDKDESQVAVFDEPSCGPRLS